MNIPPNPDGLKAMEELFFSRINGMYDDLINNKDVVPAPAGSLNQSIAASRNFDRATFGTNSRFESIASKVNDSVPNKIVPNSVGDYLYSCYTQSDNINNSCTPECLNGFSNPFRQECTLPIYQKKDNETIEQLNSAMGMNGYVFIVNGNLTTADYQKLQNDGVTNVTIYQRQGDGTYSVVEQRQVDENTKGVNIGMIIIIIIVLILLVLAIAWIFNSCKK